MQLDSSNRSKSKSNRHCQSESIIGFDYLRAIYSIFVVIGHTDALRILAINETAKNLLAIYYQNIGLLAVPVFLQISLYLFYQKQHQEPNYFYRKRFSRLLLIYGFWVPLAIVGKTLLGEIEPIKIVSSLPYFIWVLVTGGDTLFYFLFALLNLSFLADLQIKIKTKFRINQSTWKICQWIGLACSSLLLVGLSIAGLVTQKYIFVAYNNPLNFLPYIFSAYLIWDNTHTQGAPKFSSSKVNKAMIVMILAAILFFVILEWHFFDLSNYPKEFFSGDILPQYARLSSVLASSLITYLFVIWDLPSISLVQFISYCSLGIYCIHKFLPNFIGLAASKVTVLFGYNLITDIPMMSFLRFWSLLLGSIVLTLVLKKIKLLKQVV